MSVVLSIPPPSAVTLLPPMLLSASVIVGVALPEIACPGRHLVNAAAETAVFLRKVELVTVI